MPTHRSIRWLAALLSLAAPPLHADITFSKPHALSPDHGLRSTFQGVRLLGAVSLSQKPVPGGSPRELSSLGWDADEGLLYAVSDNGDLLQLRPRFDGGVLIAADFVAAMPLRDAAGAPLSAAASDAEGMALLHADNGTKGDTRLAIGLEKPARLLLYRSNGELERTLELPPRLTVPKNFAEGHREIEAVALHPDLGLLLGIERPLRDADQSRLAVFDLRGNAFEFAPLDSKYSALVGLEVTPAGDLLVLERVYQSLLRPIIFAVRMISHDQLHAPGKVTAREIVKFNSRDDWAMDNFEGIAHHEGNRYFLVSDDGANPLQNTLLLYFEILPQPAGTQP
ncbi:MAG: esterase-like activity of phytase family protein [Gammaproteobacteria bacterium]|nr:esterase-like activity of phytase family protein [Gammaproteobacteria bacterium]